MYEVQSTFRYFFFWTTSKVNIHSENNLGGYMWLYFQFI